MGQRLNLEIVKSKSNHDIVLANAYYHWYGYTRSANRIASIVLEEIQNKDSTIMQIEDEKLKAIRLLELTSARISESEHPHVSIVYIGEKFEIATNRNDGLIAATENGIEETRNWEEGRVTIYLDEMLITPDCHWEYVSIDHYMEEYDIEKDEVVLLNFELDNLDGLTLSEFEKYCKICDTVSEEHTYAFTLNKMTVIALIE